MRGLSSSASAGSVGGSSGRAALARVGRAGSFLECFAGSRLGVLRGGLGGSGESVAIAAIWARGYGEGSACGGSSSTGSARRVGKIARDFTETTGRRGD